MDLTRRHFLKCACSSGAIGLLASYSIFVERYVVLTNTYCVSVPNLPTAFSGLKIVQLTDLHYGFLVPIELIQHIVNRANDLKPDLIVCTGDYVHIHRPARLIDQVWPVLSQLAAPLGVYSVLGNHDHSVDTARSDYWLKRVRQDLRHKTVRLERAGQYLSLAGAGDFRKDHRSLDTILGNVPDSDCRIVLAHNPDSADTTYSSRIDLMVSGHTHGGQINIPFIGPPVLHVRNRGYSSGIKRSPRGCTVFISKGIGCSYFPVRFNCYPEIAVLILVPQQPKDHN